MGSKIIYPNGSAVISVPAGESIAVFTKGSAQVIHRVGYPNVPAQDSVLGQVTNGQTVFGSYSSGATIVVNNLGDSNVLYQVGAAPVVTEIYGLKYQPAPAAVNVTGAVSAAAILGGLVTSTTAAAVDGTIPTGAVMDLAAEFSVDDSVDWSVINTGGMTFTVTAASGHTIVGAAAVATATTGRFRTRKTAADTFVTYRIG